MARRCRCPPESRAPRSPPVEFEKPLLLLRQRAVGEMLDQVGESDILKNPAHGDRDTDGEPETVGFYKGKKPRRRLPEGRRMLGIRRFRHDLTYARRVKCQRFPL